MSIALALVGNLATGTVRIEGAGWIAVTWFVAGGLVVAAIAIELSRVREGRAGGTARVGVTALADDLARAVQVQWQREEEHRRITDPLPLPIRWHSAPEHLVDDPSNVRGTALGVAATRLALAGELTGVSTAYRRVPSGRLVVLGRAGSGKTVLAARLLLDLLADRDPGTAVPVIFSLGSWNPAIPLRAWLADQLARDYPALAGPEPDQAPKAGALLDDGLILPILDGFDEINAGLHPDALRQLNTATTMPLLVTSRPEEYAAAVGSVDVLSRSEAIELDDLVLDDLRDYLPRTTRRTTGSVGRWQPVLDHLTSHPGTAAAQLLRKVLSTPLMVFLARTIYSDAPDRDPAELLDEQRFATVAAMEEHLLSAYLTAAYESPPDTGQHWSSERARGWLTFLALFLHDLDTPDLAWWQLESAVRRSTRFVFFAITVGLPVVAGFASLTPHRTSWLGVPALLGTAMGLGTSLSIMGFTRTTRPPARTHLRIRGSTTRIAQTMLISLCLALPTASAAKWFIHASVGLVVELALVTFGASLGLMVYDFERPVDLTTAARVTDSLRADRRTTYLQMLVFGWLVGPALGISFAIISAAASEAPARASTWTVPALFFGLAMAGVALPLCAWGRWVLLVRLWLPLTGRLPWAVMAFLMDAHRRGVLRQAGPVFQFRHARLQDHLAGTGPSAAGREAGRVGGPDR